MVGSYTENSEKPQNCQNWGVGACPGMGICLGHYGTCQPAKQGSPSPPILPFPPSFSLSPFLIPPSPLKYAHRYQCGVPVIIEGETGVGKTALVEMLSKLWNHALLLEWKRKCSRLLDLIKMKLGDITVGVSDNFQVCYNLCGTIAPWCSSFLLLSPPLITSLFLSANNEKTYCRQICC